MSAQPILPYAQAARQLLRSTLLDAIREQLRNKSWADVSMAAIAMSAGVSRQTLYKEFGSRQELAQAYVLREVDSFLASVEAAVTQHHHDPVTALSAAFEVFLAAAAEDPVVRTVVSGAGGDELLSLITSQGQPVLERATERLAAFLIEGWPAIGQSEAGLLSECVVRLAISSASLPGGPVGMTGHSVAILLGPYVERVLVSSGIDTPAPPPAPGA